MTAPGTSSQRTAVVIAAALVTVALAPSIGLESISLVDVWRHRGDPHELRIFWDLRVPRVLLGFLAGAGLSLCGLAFQAMFRNALATPFTLGISAGASFGAALAVRLGLGVSAAGALGLSGVTAAAFAGALATIALVYGLTRERGLSSVSLLLLAGVAVNFFFSSLILFVQYTSDFYDSFQILRWLMGGLGILGYEFVVVLVPVVAVGATALIFLARDLNLLTTGEELATSRGADVPRTRRRIFVVTSLMVGGIVSVCGPIGFVGMMVPHICRLLIGPDHRQLVPAVFFFGGAFLVVCDTVARTAFGATEIPVGVLTAFLGGPFFLVLLLRQSAAERIGF